MATNLNLDSLTVNANGRVSFSGLGTGIDIQGTVDALIQAKRIPIDRIEQRISQREAKIAAFDDLRSLATALRDALSKLRGAVSFDGSGDIFKAKQAFATTSRTDLQTPSAAADLVGMRVSNAAQASSHTLEIRQLATAHKVASESVAGGLNDDLALVGTFEINGRSITVGATDSLFDLRDRINAANRGEDATGVTASIVSISQSEHVLVLTADQTGTDAKISAIDTSGSVLESLGLLDSGGAYRNELQIAQNAELLVDGLGTTIERQSNTIEDVFGGVTLSLFKAEPGTTIRLDVERDLNQVKAAIVDFVDAYNEVRAFINAQAQTGIEKDDESGAGILAGTSALSEVRARLSGAIGAAAEREDPIFSVLAEIGITIQGPSRASDPLLANTLAIDETKLDQKLLNDLEGVRELFTFGFASSSSDVQLVGFDQNTGFTSGGYALNVAWSGGAIVSANLGGPADGSDDGSAVVDGKVITITSGKAKGLKVLYTGTTAESGIQIDLSVGLGAKLYNTLDALVDKGRGLIQAEIGVLEGQNASGQEQVARLEDRLERERERLLERFVAMEAALTSMNRLLDSLRRQIDSAFDSRR